MSAMIEIRSRVKNILVSDTPLFEKIEAFVNNYITMIQANPTLPMFVLNELSQHPDKFVKKFFEDELVKPTPFFEQVLSEIQAGRIKPIHPLQLMVNLMSMSMFPFVARPMLKHVTGITDAEYDAFLESRKTEVPRFIINAIKA
jgi:hypothetical protein